MTVIYSNFGDNDCNLLSYIWDNLDANVVEITPNMIDCEDLVDEAIANENDTLIFAGHGSTYGLFHPNIHTCSYLFHENNIDLVHAKNVICIWCYASTFCQTHHLRSFSTSMFISNIDEAYNNGINEMRQDDINVTSVRFYCEINRLLMLCTPLNRWRMKLLRNMDDENPVDIFNREGLHYQI